MSNATRIGPAADVRFSFTPPFYASRKTPRQLVKIGGMDLNPYESPRVLDGLEVRAGLGGRSEQVDGLPYWPFLDILMVFIMLSVIAALLMPAVMR